MSSIARGTISFFALLVLGWIIEELIDPRPGIICGYVDETRIAGLTHFCTALNKIKPYMWRSVPISREQQTSTKATIISDAEKTLILTHCQHIAVVGIRLNYRHRFVIEKNLISCARACTADRHKLNLDTVLRWLELAHSTLSTYCKTEHFTRLFNQDTTDLIKKHFDHIKIDHMNASLTNHCNKAFRQLLAAITYEPRDIEQLVNAPTCPRSASHSTLKGVGQFLKLLKDPEALDPEQHNSPTKSSQ